MEVKDFHWALALASLAAVGYVYYQRKKQEAKILLRHLIYDEDAGKLELYLKNTDSRPFFIKPSLRVIRFTPAVEWKEKTNGTNGIVMSPGANGSVIKGYDLIGEHAEPVNIQPGETKKLEYFLTYDVNLNAYDNVRVDISYGAENARLSDLMNRTIQVHLVENEIVNLIDELLEESQVKDPADGGQLESAPAPIFDGGFIQGGYPVQADGGLGEAISLDVEDGGITSPSVLESGFNDDGFADELVSMPETSTIKSNGFPVKAMCFCCGKSEWLKWVYDNQHVCTECKDYLKVEYNLVEEEVDPEAVKTSHRQILGLLRAESNLSASQIAEKLCKDRAKVGRDMKQLFEEGQVKRMKSGSSYYYSNTE